MPLFSRRDKEGRKSAAAAAEAADPVDAAGLSQALLVELRGQRQDFKQTYALLESRLDKLEKAINRQPREAGGTASTAAAARSPSDEETRYVLGDAESMEIIVNLGPLRTGRPLSVERRALTPSARKWWGLDQDDEHAAGPAGHAGHAADSRHASFHAGKHAAQAATSSPSSAGGAGAAAGASRAPSSYHWVIGRDSALREQRPPSPTSPPPTSPSTQPAAPSRSPPPPRTPAPPMTPTKQPPFRPPSRTPAIVTPPPCPVPASKCLPRPETAPTRTPPAAAQDCVVLLAPDDPRGGAGVRRPGPASSVCFVLEEGDDKEPRRRGALGRPLSRLQNGEGKSGAGKDGDVKVQDAKTVEDKKTTQDEQKAKDDKVGPGPSESSLKTLHRSPQADCISAKVDTLAVPSLVRPSSSVCFSLEEYERDQAAEEPRRARAPPADKDLLAVPKAARPAVQYRPHAMHGPYGPHRPHGAKRSASAARLAWWKRSPPPSVPPPGRSSRPGPHCDEQGGTVDEEGLRSCLRCAEYRVGPRTRALPQPRTVPEPRVPVRLRIASSRQTRPGPRPGLGAQLRAWDGSYPRRHRSPHRRPRHLQDDDEANDSRPVSRVGSSRVPSRESVRGGSLAKSNIHLAKIYAKTDLVRAAAAEATPPPPARPARYRPLQHLPTCPRYDGPASAGGGPTNKQLVTLFESPAVGQATRAAAAQAAREHRDYLAHLSEYVRAISKGPQPATVIRNQLRVLPPSRSPSPSREPSPRRGAERPRRREQLRWRTPPAIMDGQEVEAEAGVRHARARSKGEPQHTAHRKHTCRDSRAQRRPRAEQKAAHPLTPTDTPVDSTGTPPGHQDDDATPRNNTICSFICDYCSKLRQML
ncbi:Treslin [Frankliniella fusca]|uniref:Treslin n=1 Tax=Frankliniella fusca TaxID=407009 RepID=A0AAE1I0C6_9NEOP|nr:Treslin [Frankliniella fusca]